MISFRDSFEYDINHTEAGQSIIKRYDLCDEVFTSDDTNIYILKEIETGEKQLLKAIRLKPNIEFDIEKVMRVNHEGIAKIYEYYTSENYLYLIKEFVEGIDVENYIKLNGPMNENNMISLIIVVIYSSFDSPFKQFSIQYWFLLWIYFIIVIITTKCL